LFEIRKRKEERMNLYNKSKNKGSGFWSGIKKLIDDILTDIEENFEPKLKPIKIKNNENNK
jgi:hypothetical protein